MAIPINLDLQSSAETARDLGIRPNTLEIWRTKGIGPQFFKVGRSIRYSRAVVASWLLEHQHRHTSSYADGGRNAFADRQGGQ